MARTLSSRRLWRGSPLNVAREERQRTFEGRLGADDARTQGQHVHVVVLDALVGRVGVVADGGTDPAHLVGGHRRTDPGAADEDAALRGAARDGVAQALGEVGVVIVRVGAVAAEVDEVVADARPRSTAGSARP